jgi:hypothetical protein
MFMNNLFKLFSIFFFLICISTISNQSVFAQNNSSNSGTEISFSKADDSIIPGGSPNNTEVETEIHYDGANTSGVGAASSNFIIAARYTTTQTAGHIGEYIKRVRVYIRNPTSGNTATVRIYAAGTPTAPGTLIYSQPFATTSDLWHEVTLNSPVLVPNADIWVGVEATALASPNQFWGGTDAGPNHPDGQWIFFSGAWATLTALNPALTFNWNIRAVVDEIVGPGQATNPNPAHNATNINITGTNLSWTNPAGTVSNQVYFGTNPASLNLIHSGSLISSISAPSPLSYFTVYYWRVDEIDGTGTSTGSQWSFRTILDPAGVVLPYSQSFNATTFPAFWSQTFEGGVTSNRWGISPTNVAGGTANEIFATWVEQIGVSRLIIGPINTSGITNLGLSFRQFFDDYAAGVTYKIQSSVNGTTWTDEAFNFASGNGDAGPELVYTNIANNVGSTTYIAWVLDGDHYQFDFWVLDDVSIYQLLTNDVGTISVDIEPTLPTGSFAPQARVQNFGSVTNTFNVQMTITGGYSSTKTVTNLAPNASQVVTFDSWNATGGSYTVNVCTQLGTDLNTSNDCLPKNVTVIDGWTHNSVYPTTTYLGSGVAGNGFLYSVGGNTTSALGTECYKYNVATNTWTQIASLPQGRRVLATAMVGNFIYAVGGSDMTSVYRASVYRYDITGDSWSLVDSLPSAVAWGKAVGYNNRIYFAGGVGSTGTIVSSVYVYDVSANTWTSATSMPGEKFGGAFSISGNKLIYVAGADDDGISSTVYVGTIDAGNPLNISWTTALNKFPGVDAQLSNTNQNSIFDLYEGQTKVKRNNLLPTDALPYPAGAMYRFDGAPWGSDGIIVAGGSPTSAFTPATPNPCYVYKPGTDSWVQQGEVPTAVLGSALGSVNSGSVWKLIVASGLSSTVVSNATQVFTADLGGAPTTFPLSVSINNGWNMVSTPGLHPTNQNVTTWWAGKDPAAGVFRFSGGYIPVTTTIPGQGYWMKHTGANIYNTGDEYPAGGIQIVANDPIVAATGWNLIGGYESSVATSGITTTPAGLQTGSVFQYGTGYTVATTLVPGYGYWVKLTGAGQINIPASLAKGLAKTEVNTSDWGKIIITDKSGKSYTLYTVKGEVNLNDFELPPAPPTGMFDVRFGSGRYAEELSAVNQSIELNSLEYPVTVRVENADIRLQDGTGNGLNERLKSGEEVIISNSAINKLMVSGDVIPATYSLDQNYPNPFNPSTKIEFSIPEDVNNVTLTIYNALGQRVAELVNSRMEAGKYSYVWNASDVATGLYIYELRTDKFVSVKKMLLLK